jgi:hypothetical protein
MKLHQRIRHGKQNTMPPLEPAAVPQIEACLTLRASPIMTQPLPRQDTATNA